MSQETAVKDHDEQPWGFVGRISHLAHNELVGGGVLLLATVIAIVLANTPASHEVEGLLGSELGFGLGALDLRHSVHAWVNDALMALFFFVVGLEIKQELTTGDLRTPQKAALPVVAALGGMIVPAAIFLLWNGGTETSVGWGVPMATDIAFALAVLGVVGRGLPSGLRTFLLALAIADDLGAILVIAVFYTETIDTTWLTVAVLGLGLVVMMRRAGVNLVSAYVPVGVLVWYATLESGIHATIAGVAIGLLTPALVAHGERSWARVLQQRLHPFSVFVVLPLFALTNAGVELSPGSVAEAAVSPVALGVVTGLVLGKAVGILVFTRFAVKRGVGSLPEGVEDGHVLGVGVLAGIGFTVSLFVTGLAFENAEHVAAAKTGIVVASVFAAIAGAQILRRTTPAPQGVEV